MYGINKDDLIRFYHEDLLSLPKIASMYGVNVGTVWRVFKKFGIPLRDFRVGAQMHHDEAHGKPISPELVEFVEGNLLGDGSLRKTATNAQYVHGDKHKEYIEWVAGWFRAEGINVTIWKVRDNYWSLQTEVNTHLTSVYSRWYPQGLLTLPEDEAITPVKLRQWFIGDGSKTTSGGRSISKDSRLSRTDKARLQTMINSELGIQTTWHRDRGNDMSRLYFRARDTSKFLAYIGECPVGCYKYKW